MQLVSRFNDDPAPVKGRTEAEGGGGVELGPKLSTCRYTHNQHYRLQH